MAQAGTGRGNRPACVGVKPAAAGMPAAAVFMPVLSAGLRRGPRCDVVNGGIRDVIGLDARCSFDQVVQLFQHFSVASAIVGVGLLPGFPQADPIPGCPRKHLCCAPLGHDNRGYGSSLRDMRTRYGLGTLQEVQCVHLFCMRRNYGWRAIVQSLLRPAGRTCKSNDERSRADHGLGQGAGDPGRVACANGLRAVDEL